MPELPEVETTCRGIRPHIQSQSIQRVIIRQTQLRWLIPKELIQILPQQTIRSVTRRGKYLLLKADTGTLILHLGMSGSLRVLNKNTAAQKHDHFDLVFENTCLRLRDPRRFGAVLWTSQDPQQHKLIKHLGPEPLTQDFNPQYLYQRSRQRKLPIKNFIMDGKVVVGVGNIYANEALFMSGIHPKRGCSRISKQRYALLVNHIKVILKKAIEQGGTTLKDFSNQDGKPGYFAQSLNVYGKEGKPCPQCKQSIVKITIGQRSSFYCQQCQT